MVVTGRDRPLAGACCSPLGFLAKKESDAISFRSAARGSRERSTTVGRAIVEHPFCGTLHVGDDQESASSSAPDAATLCALLLAELPEPAVTLLERLPKGIAVAGEFAGR